MISGDILWKGIIRNLFIDFLAYFFSDAIHLIDFAKGFESLDKELSQISPDSDQNSRYVDLLVKLFFRDGTENWVLVHVEVQGYVDKDFPRRMFVYHYRIRDLFDKPVTSLAFLTDETENFHPKSYEKEFLGTRIFYGFNTWKLAEKTQEAFDDKSNIFSIVMETAWYGLSKNRKDDEKLFHQTRQLIRRLLEGGFPKTKIRKVYSLSNTTLPLKSLRFH
jgi:hypothetical protein